VGGGVGIASAFPATMLLQQLTLIKLSELAIGPFVIEPAVSRKINLKLMHDYDDLRSAWLETGWYENGLYAKF
jgi:hypothetical protein